ncbi:MAG: ATP-binding protein, partial [Myxococcota bacterium]
VYVRVRDSGPGIPREDLARIFVPFFTTKPNGTGLGLAISQRIVETAGGRIDVTSRVGEGTTITVRMPALIESLLSSSSAEEGGDALSKAPKKLPA